MQPSNMGQSSIVTEHIIKSSPVDAALCLGDGQVTSPHWAGVKYDLISQTPRVLPPNTNMLSLSYIIYSNFYQP